MDSETKTFYFIVIVWLLLVLLGSLLQRCCVHRDLHSIHTSYLYGDTGPPTDYCKFQIYKLFFSWLINFLIFLLWKIVFLRTEYPRYYSFIFAVSQGNEPGNRTGYDRSPEYLITCLEQRGGPSIRTNEVDKPPSYDGGERELYEDMSVLKIIRRN